MERTPEFLALYPDGYGRYKKPVDYARCCERVYSGDVWAGSTQCARKNGYGPHGAYCKQHDPDAVKAKREAKRAQWNAEWDAKRRDAAFTADCRNAIRLIADGHNDPRALAQSIIDKLEGKP